MTMHSVPEAHAYLVAERARYMEAARTAARDQREAKQKLSCLYYDKMITPEKQLRIEAIYQTRVFALKSCRCFIRNARIINRRLVSLKLFARWFDSLPVVS